MAMIIQSSDGDQLDTLCYAHYGHLNGTVEAVLQANPGLSAIQQPYSIGTTIRFPDLKPMSTESINLWN
ncbi:MAG: tail protein X [Candidatus Symbiodolus clandestinus]